MLAGSGNPLFILAALVGAAVMVFWVGSRRFSKERSSSALRPRGRVLFDHPRRRSERWRKSVASLERRDPTPVADAKEGAVRLSGLLVNASGNLGGTPGRECVWRNRAGGQPASAVGAEIVFLQDDSGTCGIEGLEQAYVIAPSEKHTFHHENVALYLGDRVEVYGRFTPEQTAGGDDDPIARVYGTLAFDDGLDVRLLERPKPEVDDDPPPSPSNPEATAKQPCHDSNDSPPDSPPDSP